MPAAKDANYYRRKARVIATHRGLDPDLFGAQINQESHFTPHISSKAGAQGIAQIMPATAAAWHVDPNDPIAALRSAADHMKAYVSQYGNWKDALTAYNAGPGAVGHALPAETRGYISSIMGGGGSGGSSPVTTSETPTQTADTGPQDRWARMMERFQQMDQTLSPTPQPQATQPGLGGFLQRMQQENQNLLNQNMTQLRSLHSSTVDDTLRPGNAITEPGTGTDSVRQVFERAVAIDAKHAPYKWGGGHGPQPTLEGPWDCSGAVSAVLGVNPRVSGDFAKWGESGHGKNITVYANGEHTLMEINGHFFGTSRSNPQGGAGWIPRSAVSPEYLKRFTVRHPAGM